MMSCCRPAGPIVVTVLTSSSEQGMPTTRSLILRQVGLASAGVKLVGLTVTPPASTLLPPPPTVPADPLFGEPPEPLRFDPPDPLEAVPIWPWQPKPREANPREANPRDAHPRDARSGSAKLIRRNAFVNMCRLSLGGDSSGGAQ